jgi:hypothetical protein
MILESWKSKAYVPVVFAQCLAQTSKHTHKVIYSLFLCTKLCDRCQNVTELNSYNERVNVGFQGRIDVATPNCESYPNGLTWMECMSRRILPRFNDNRRKWIDRHCKKIKLA